MVSIRFKYLILSLCILVSSWLLFAQAMGSVILLLPCLLCFLALTVWSAVKGMATPIFVFFLPFSPLLKIEQGSISFFTIALLCVYLVYMVMGSKNINVHHLVPGLCIIALTMVVKTLYGYSFDNSYILFSATLLLIPFISREINGKYDFHLLTLFFVLGISIAAITSQYLIYFPNISRFIRTFDLLGTIRYAGYYGDPNFYSAHITAALGGVLILLLETVSKKKLVALILMAGTLVYCGFLSVSKTFFLITVCLMILWILALLFNRGKISVKITMILVIIVGVVFLLSSTVFTDAVDAIIARFGRDNNISDFTTGRTDIWMEYLQAFAEDPLLLLFGKGYTSVLIGGTASHNTIIQAIFQFGLIGCVFLVAWFLCLFHNLLITTSFKMNSLVSVLILLLGAIGPWMALDMVHFDEFFLIPLYICVGIRFLSKETTVDEPKTEMG